MPHFALIAYNEQVKTLKFGVRVHVWRQGDMEGVLTSFIPL